MTFTLTFNIMINGIYSYFLTLAIWYEHVYTQMSFWLQGKVMFCLYMSVPNQMLPISYALGPAIIQTLLMT